MSSNNKYGLSFISDIDLYEHVKKTVEEYSFEIDLKKFNQNIIDPIKLTFDTIVYNQTLKTTIENEVLRQLDKTNSNSIGYFHQNIFDHFGGNWHVLKNGYDVVNEDLNIFCELKNKHNTMNSSSGVRTYMRMQNTLIENRDATCMLVEVIATKSQNIPWVITLDGNRQKSNERIRRVSIDKFYEIVTGVPNSFSQLCKVLPQVISDVVRNNGSKSKRNTVLQELGLISSDLATSIFLLAFSNYEGFGNFKINMDGK